MRRFTHVTSFFCLLVLLASCGAPTQKYGASKSEGVYFAVPVSWHAISTNSLNLQESKSKVVGAAEKLALVKWQYAFTFDKRYSAKDIFSFAVTKTPVAFARVRSLFPDEVNAISYNSLRNVVVPLTDWVNYPDKTTPEFNILDDYEVVEKGARGVRTIYSFTQNGKSQTVDQTAMVSEDRQTIYVFVVRCANSCYDKRKSLITKIADSFTVRGAR